jgi:signal transduction histidine kinase
MVMQFGADDLHAAADPVALGTVVDQLLENAVKYSEGGFVVLAAKAEGEHVAISVSDRGIGMDDEQALHCFDKFWQAESTDVRRFGGTGIGLHIVKSLVVSMGGTVTVQSAPGRGSRFTVRLASSSCSVPATPSPGVGDPSSIKEFMRQIGVPSEVAS